MPSSGRTLHGKITCNIPDDAEINPPRSEEDYIRPFLGEGYRLGRAWQLIPWVPRINED